MKVEVRLYASLQDYLPEKKEGPACLIDLPEGSTVDDLLRLLRVPQNAVKVVFRNGIHARGDEVLKDGDRVGAFPPVAGG